MADSGKTIIDVVVEDHQEVEQLFRRAESTSDPEERQDLANQIIADIVRHAVAEEQHLYPAMREHLGNGNEMADHEIEEHTEIEERLKALESMDPREEGFDQQLSGLINDVRHHVQDEEQDSLPQLERACDHDTLVQLGEKMERAKLTAPTRAHPSAPNTPPLNKILAPGAGLVDRVRDALIGRSAI